MNVLVLSIIAIIARVAKPVLAMFVEAMMCGVELMRDLENSLSS